jgi:hypothetical protein
VTVKKIFAGRSKRALKDVEDWFLTDYETTVDEILKMCSYDALEIGQEFEQDKAVGWLVNRLERYIWLVKNSRDRGQPDEMIHAAIAVGVFWAKLQQEIAKKAGGRKGEQLVWVFIGVEYDKNKSVKIPAIVRAALDAYTAATGKIPKGKPESYERNFRKHIPV